MWSQWAWVRKMSPAIGSPLARSTSDAAQLADAGAGVEDDQPAFRGAQLDAGRVAAVADRAAARGSGSSRASPRIVGEAHGVALGTADTCRGRRTRARTAVTHLRDSCHIRTCARCSSASRSATAMRRRSTRDPARVLELLHRARHGLAARADHLGDGLMRERLLDRVAARSRRRDRAAGGRCGPGRRAARGRRSSRRRGAGGATAR